VTQEEQTYGPITLKRFRKDDGRALILFSRGASEEARGTPNETDEDRRA